MQGKDLLMGTLKQGGYLRTESGETLLTSIPMQAAQSPESAALEIAPEDVGKMALVRGDLSGNVLYSASIVEALSPISSILFKTLINKDFISLEDIQHQISELESMEEETKEQKNLCALVIGHKKPSPGAINAKANLS
ncbi:hypothetical protein GTO36_08940, partial [bacterium]|nr:hypothetical protein [bacterium]